MFHFVKDDAKLEVTYRQAIYSPFMLLDASHSVTHTPSAQYIKSS
jgi:hypothetical protein